jgi:hypothetical protein
MHFFVFNKVALFHDKKIKNLCKQRVFRCVTLFNQLKTLTFSTKQQKPKLVFPTVIFFFEIQEPSRYKSNGHLSPSPSFSHTAPLSLKKNLSAHLKQKQSEIKSLSSISGLKVSLSDLISLSNTLDSVLNS